MKTLGHALGFYVFALGFSILFSSCSSSMPQIADTSASVVFDFEDYESYPKVRLSVFAEMQSDFRRVGEISAFNIGTSQEWICKNPRKITDNGKKTWVGYTNFLPAEDSALPLGKYEFNYTDLAENQVTTSFYVSYPSAYLEAKAGDFPDLINSSRHERIALYNKSGNMFYYGDVKKEWKTDADIKKTYSQLVKYRRCYVTNNSGVVVMMPFVSIKNNNSED